MICAGLPRDGVRRNACHHRAGGYHAARADRQAAHDRAASADPNVVLYNNVSFAGGVFMACSAPAGKMSCKICPSWEGRCPIGAVVSAEKHCL